MRPGISVVIATRNRAAVLAETLRHLESQDAGGRTWEVVVVDNGSTDRTGSVISEASARLPVVSVVEPEGGKNRALNAALGAVRGDLVLFTDDDVIPCTRWIALMAAAAERWPDHAVFAGAVHPAFPRQTPEWLANHPFAAIAFAKFDLGPPERPLDISPHGPNYAVRASHLRGLRFLESMGPSSDPRGPLGDETEFLRRLRRSGAGTIYVPDAAVQHRVEPHQLELNWLFERSFRAGRGAVCLDPDRISKRLWGVPRHVLRRLSSAAVRHLLQAASTDRRRFASGIELHYVRGELFEYRRGAHAS